MKFLSFFASPTSGLQANNQVSSHPLLVRTIDETRPALCSWILLSLGSLPSLKQQGGGSWDYSSWPPESSPNRQPEFGAIGRCARTVNREGRWGRYAGTRIVQITTGGISSLQLVVQCTTARTLVQRRSHDKLCPVNQTASPPNNPLIRGHRGKFFPALTV